MAKKQKAEEQEIEASEEDLDVNKLTRALIKTFNKDEDKTGRIAWNLVTDLDNPTDVKEFISTGNTLLDYEITNKKDGGVPVGKLTEIVGEEASGKSLLCAHLAANAQKKGGVVAYIDTENALNPDFAQQIGVDLSKMIYLQPGTVEEVGEAIVKMIVMTRQKAAKQLVLIIWDSTAQTPTKAEIEGEFEINMNVQMEKPKALAKMMRKITQTLGKERICLVFTNQLKMRPDAKYGDPFFAPGGKAVPYAASVRIRLNKGKAQREGANPDAEAGEGDGEGDVMGVHTTAKVIKNRLGPPSRSCKFFISFEHGIEDESSWFNYLHSKGVVVKGAPEASKGFVTIPEFRPIISKHYLDMAEDVKKSLDSEQDKDKLKELKRQFREYEELAIKATPDGDNKGWQFRESQWLETLNNTPRLKDWVLNKLDELLVVKYGQKSDGEVDEDSLLEVEQLVDDIKEE